MSDDLVKHCMCGCMYLEAECPNCNKVTDADRIQTLTEQLEAARADAKEAEAYAEGLEKEIELNEQEACMLENDLIKADKEIDDLKAKLAKAVEALDDLLEAITAEDRFGDRSLTITGPTANLKWLLETEEEARTTLAEIEGSDAA